MSDSVTIEDSKGNTFAEVIDVIGTSEIKKAFQQSVKEGSLHKWFKGSKSKDGKPGWVNVVTGGTCASDKPGEGTPKCVSASKRASMTKAERLSASRRKKKADPGQQAKSGAAKPTYVSTDKKKKMSEEIKRDEYGDPIGGPKISKKQLKKNLMKNEPDEQHNTKMGESTEITEGDKKGKGSGSKDACYHKVKSRYSVWPSAYASGALVKCRKVGAANWGNSTKKEEYIPEEGYDIARDRGMVRPSKDKKDATTMPVSDEMRKTQKVNKGPSAYERVKAKYGKSVMDMKKEEVELDEKCWKGYKKKGMKTMFGKRYPNCVKAEFSDWRDELEYIDEAAGKAITTGLTIAGKQIAKRGAKRAAKRAAIKVGGKAGAKAAKKAGKVAATETKKAAVETAAAVGQGASKGLKKRKERTLEKIKRKSEEMVSGEGKKKPQNVSEQGGINWSDPLNIEKLQPAVQGATNTAVKGAAKIAGIGVGAYLGGKLIGKAIDGKKKKKNKTVKEDKSPAWQRKEGKSESGGLNKKGVASYRAANPGSKLKTAVTTKPSKLKKGSKAANRRKSFCSRMKGMKAKLTSAKTARDPDSRINKSLRKWNC